MACRFLLSLAIRSPASPQENIILKTPDDFVGGEKSNKKNPPLRGLCDALRFDFGGDEEDRTPDLRIANAALSQLSYVPLFLVAILARKPTGNNHHGVELL